MEDQGSYHAPQLSQRRLGPDSKVVGLPGWFHDESNNERQENLY
jgi:hypothetical protein